MNITEQEIRGNRIRNLNRASLAMSAILLIFIIVEQKMDLRSKGDNLIQTIYFSFILIFASLRLASYYFKRKEKFQ